MKQEKIYGLYENGYLVYKGTRFNICENYGIKPNSFYEYLKGHRRLNGVYVVDRICGDEPIVRQPKIKQKREKDKRMQRFEYLFTMLKWYGNTRSSFDPHPFLDDLKAKGIEAIVYDKGDHYYLEVNG